MVFAILQGFLVFPSCTPCPAFSQPACGGKPREHDGEAGPPKSPVQSRKLQQQAGLGSKPEQFFTHRGMFIPMPVIPLAPAHIVATVE
jgi:hypothetical protein